MKFFQIIFDMLIIFISPMRDGQTKLFLLTPLSQMDCILALLFYQKVLLLIFISRPLPPWYLQQPSLHSNSDFWLQNSASARHSDLSVGGDSSGSDIKTSYNSRIPILVATTTEPPRRIPITITTPTTTTTTSEPETTSSTTSETVPTTPDVSEETSKEADVLLQRTNEVVINHELGEG